MLLDQGLDRGPVDSKNLKRLFVVVAISRASRQQVNLPGNTSWAATKKRDRKSLLCICYRMVTGRPH